jgi:NUMOD4 motif/HNH endonuclease
MTKNYIGEQWKKIEFDFEYSNESRFEISNFGRVRTYNKISKGKIVNGSMINGYKIIRLRFYKPRGKDAQDQLNFLQAQVLELTKQLTILKKSGESEAIIKEKTELLDGLKLNVKKKNAEDTNSRSINWHSLIHRLVAKYFLQQASAGHTVVAHLNHEKLNNWVGNLKWMTPSENYEHQKNSPYVINYKLEKKQGNRDNSKITKLTVTRVMLLKKMLNQGKPMKQLVRLFKVTETQIIRIRRGENWKDIKAAN